MYFFKKYFAIQKKSTTFASLELAEPLSNA